MQENIIVVDEFDNQIWEWEKMDVHRKALLHRAFSILIFNDNWELMLQQRDLWKYHSWGKWTNTCCSHPRVGESLDDAIHRRLFEEMWFDTKLNKKTEFIYNVELDNELTENEYLHVYTWLYNDEPKLNKDEAMNWKWISIDDLKKDIEENSDNYTKWFYIIVRDYFDRVFK